MRIATLIDFILKVLQAAGALFGATREEAENQCRLSKCFRLGSTRRFANLYYLLAWLNLFDQSSYAAISLDSLALVHFGASSAQESHEDSLLAPE